MANAIQYILLIFQITALDKFTDAVRFRCDYSYSDVGWLKYHVVPETWQNARLRCRYEGGMLVSPVSPEIKAAMMNSIRNIDILTGIHATVSSGSFYTLDGISLDAITHSWADNEPDNKNNAENCIAMNSDGNFSDVSCDVPRPYMCYRANSLQDVNSCGTPDPGQTLKEAGFDKFSRGQPDNSTTGEYCGSVFRTGQLNDLWCEYHYPFICEKNANYPALCDSNYFNEQNTVRSN